MFKNLKSKMPKILNYMKDHHLQLFAIALMIVLIHFDHLIYDEIRAKSILKPLIILDTIGDKDKKAPELTEGVNIFKSWLHGFRVKWEKEGWRAVNWELERTNFKNKDRYLLLFKGKAAKKGKITLTLVDNSGYYINFLIPVDKNITEKTHYLGSSSIKKCFMMEIENNAPVEKEFDIALFNWEHIERIQLSRYHEEKGENEITFSKLMILWVDYEVQ